MPKLADLFAAVPATPVPASAELAALRARFPAICFVSIAQSWLRHDRGISGICSRCHTKTPAPDFSSTGVIAQQGR